MSRFTLFCRRFSRVAPVALAVVFVLSVAGVASATTPPPVTATSFGIDPASYVTAAVTVVGTWLGPALQAGIGLLAIYAGYKLIRRMITR